MRQRKSEKNHISIMKSSANFSLKCVLSGWIFYYNFFMLKNLSAQCGNLVKYGSSCLKQINIGSDYLFFMFFLGSVNILCFLFLVKTLIIPCCHSHE